MHNTLVRTDTQIGVWTLANLERETVLNILGMVQKQTSKSRPQLDTKFLPFLLGGEEKWMEKDKNEVIFS